MPTFRTNAAISTISTVRQGLDMQASLSGIGYVAAFLSESPGDQPAPVHDSYPKEKRGRCDELG